MVARPRPRCSCSQQFPLDARVATGDGRVYRLCDRVEWRMAANGRLTDQAPLPPRDDRGEFCGLIRVLALSYVEEPFQVELYGEAAEG